MASVVSSPEILADLFAADPEVHLYGLADLEEPFWSLSRWWMEGEAAVGLIGFPGSANTAAYAMSERAPGSSLDLLVALSGEIPTGTLVTGPVGLADLLGRERDVRELGLHWRLIHDGRTAESRPEVVPLREDDIDALAALHATDPGAVFFLPHMVTEGAYVGIWEDGRLVASAGTHVVSRLYGVAAIGAVITDPAERGRGLGRAVTEGLTAALAARVGVIGLNVAADNVSALRLYERLGFTRRFPYEEVELL